MRQLGEELEDLEKRKRHEKQELCQIICHKVSVITFTFLTGLIFMFKSPYKSFIVELSYEFIYFIIRFFKNRGLLQQTCIRDGRYIFEYKVTEVTPFNNLETSN